MNRRTFFQCLPFMGCVGQPSAKSDELQSLCKEFGMVITRKHKKRSYERVDMRHKSGKMYTIRTYVGDAVPLRRQFVVIEKILKQEILY